MRAELPDCRHLENVPLDGHVELGEVDADGDHVAAGLLVHMPQVHLHPNTVNDKATHAHHYNIIDTCSIDSYNLKLTLLILENIDRWISRSYRLFP